MLNGHLVYDCFPFYNEIDLLEIRLHELSSIVDRFVIAEASITHQGKPKPSYLNESRARFSDFKDRVLYLPVEDFPPADFSRLGESWKVERHQRDALRRALEGVPDDTLVIHSDVDEIPRAEAVRAFDPAQGFASLDLSQHCYWINHVCRTAPYPWAKIFRLGAAHALTPSWSMCQIRYMSTPQVIPKGGWHFSFMGGVAEVQAKMRAWAHQEYNIPERVNEARIRSDMAAGYDPHGAVRDGREVKYTLEPLDEHYPEYVLTNRAKFASLIREVPVPMPDLTWNRRTWDEYAWPEDGDEWKEMASSCGISYDRWKASLIEAFIAPHVRPTTSVLEIGPGHGRWTEDLHKRAGTYIGIDVSPRCVEHCRKRFPTLRFEVGDGTTLPAVAKDSIDFAFAFDVFVHIEETETRAYVKELWRVLRSGAMGCVHHPGDRSRPEQRRLGCRSDMDSKCVASILRAQGFFVIRQTDAWSGGDVKMAGDAITLFARP